MHSGSKVSTWIVLASVIAFAVISGADSARAANWRPKLGGKFSVAPSYFPEDIAKGTNQWSTPVRLEPELSLRPTRALRLRIAPYLYADPSSTSEREKFIFDLTEANADIRRRDWSFKLGVNSVSWGVTDVYNPLDVVSARRYMDPLNSEKRGVPSVIAGWTNGTWRAEALYVPVQFESILPGENSRWLPRDITYNRSNDFGTLLLAPNFKYNKYEDKLDVDGALKNNYGARLERTGNGLDVSLIYFQGAPTAPAMLVTALDGTQLSLNPNIFRAEQVTLQPTYYQRRTAGLGVVWTLETAIVRAAFANSDRLSTRTDLPGWSQSGVIGVEKNFAVAASTLTMLLQATHARNEDRADNTITSLDRIFDQSWLLGLRLATSSDWTFGFATLYEAVYQGAYGQVKAERKLSDGFTGTFQIDVIDGRAGTPLGTYSRNDRATLGLSLFW